MLTVISTIFCTLLTVRGFAVLLSRVVHQFGATPGLYLRICRQSLSLLL